MKYYAGLDIGGTKCAVILGNSSLEIVEKVKFDTKAGRPAEDILLELKTGLDGILKNRGLIPEDIVSIGISCGGPLDSKNGVILSPPNLPGWDQIRITDYFSKIYNIPVFLENDANACALAEWRLGAGLGTENMIFLTFGTGMGAGLILNNRLYRGKSDMAGEVGHMRLQEDGPSGYGKKGSFEGFCSGGGMRELSEKYFGEKITVKEAAKLAYEGDARALELFFEAGKYLGKGLAVLIDILNPDMIVIGSIYARCEALLKDSMEAELAGEALEINRKDCKVVPAKLGESIGDFGALMTAFYKMNPGKI